MIGSVGFPMGSALVFGVLGATIPHCDFFCQCFCANMRTHDVPCSSIFGLIAPYQLYRHNATWQARHLQLDMRDLDPTLKSVAHVITLLSYTYFLSLFVSAKLTPDYFFLTSVSLSAPCSAIIATSAAPTISCPRRYKLQQDHSFPSSTPYRTFLV